MRIRSKSSIGASSRNFVQKTRVTPFRLSLTAALAAAIFLVAAARGLAERGGQSDSELLALGARLTELIKTEKFAEAIPLAKRFLKAVETRVGKHNPNYAAPLNVLAELYRFQRRYAEADPLYKRVLAIQEKALPEGHPDIAVSLNRLAPLYDDQARYAEAEPLAMREKSLPKGHPDIATSLHNLAGLYHSQGRYAEAEPGPAPSGSITSTWHDTNDTKNVTRMTLRGDRFDFTRTGTLPNGVRYESWGSGRISDHTYMSEYHAKYQNGTTSTGSCSGVLPREGYFTWKCRDTLLGKFKGSATRE